MPIKRNSIKSFLSIWIAIIGIGFTTLSFYDFNPKSTLTEITEEVGEDGGDLANEEDGDSLINFEPIFNASKFQLVLTTDFLNKIICSKTYKTSNGFMLDLIKPPLS